MATSKQQTLQFGRGESLFCQGDFRVNHSAKAESVKAKKTTAISGLKCLERYEKFSRSTSWAKTFLDSLIVKTEWYSSKCALTWKMKATKSSRLLFQLVPSTHHIEGIASGLLPTPTAMMPADIDMEKLEARRAKAKLSKKNGNGFGMSLNEMAKKELLPTPIAADCGEKLTGLENQDSLTKRVRIMTGKTSRLNPLYVEEMMGYPIGFTDLKDLEMPLFHRYRIKFSKQ